MDLVLTIVEALNYIRWNGRLNYFGYIRHFSCRCADISRGVS